MKVSKEKVEQNRAALVAAASSLLKEKGIDGAGVVEISARAGLSQGGFYGQFSSKDALVVEACATALSAGVNAWMEARGTKGNDAQVYIDLYLDDEHVRNAAAGCPAAAYSGEIFRQSEEVARAFTEGVRPMISMIEEALAFEISPDEARGRALFMMAAMAGAVALARAFGRTDPELSADLVTAARRQLRELTH